MLALGYCHSSDSGWLAHPMPRKRILAICVATVFFIPDGASAEDKEIASASQLCRNNPDTAARLESCSYVIKRTSDRNLLGRTFNRRGNANLILSNYSAAERDFSQAIRLSPGIAGYYDNRQYTLRMMRRYDEALRDANTAIRIAPTYSFVYRSRGNVYADKLMLDLAIADFTKAIEIDALDASLFVDRARLYGRKSLNTLAINDFTQALAIDRKNVNIFKERGLIYFRTGDLDKARSDLSLFLKSNPADTEVMQTFALLTLPKNSPTSQTAVDAPSKNEPPPPIISTLKPQERRVALVIGNGAYANVGHLQNPIQDAESIAQALRTAGFQKIYLKKDLGYASLGQAIADFSAEADKADWALVYYAGHGIEVNNLNYLIPIDASLKTNKSVQFETISLDQLTDSIAGARKLSIVLLDACRNNPFLERMVHLGRIRSANSGLAKVEPYGSTMIAFSAKAGQFALDGVSGEKNSPFVTALIKNLSRTKVDIRKFFGLVRDDVLAATNRQQEPAIYGSLGGDDYFISMPELNIPLKPGSPSP